MPHIREVTIDPYWLYVYAITYVSFIVLVGIIGLVKNIRIVIRKRKDK